MCQKVKESSSVLTWSWEHREYCELILVSASHLLSPHGWGTGEMQKLNVTFPQASASLFKDHKGAPTLVSPAIQTGIRVSVASLKTAQSNGILVQDGYRNPC